MNVVVTGCAGFIGSRVAAWLLEQGHGVVGIDNLNDAYDARLKEWRLAQLKGPPSFHFHHLDITDRPALLELFSQVRSSNLLAVINLAARAGVRESVKDPWSYYQTNVVGTLNLLEACRQHGVGKFVHASSSSVYGNPGRGAASEGKGAGETRGEGPIADLPSTVLRKPFSEGDPTDRPLSPYAASKKAAEELCYSYHHLHGLDVTVLRYFTVYGPAGRPDMAVFRFIKWIDAGETVTVYGDGEQERDFMYVEDIAQGTVAALGLKGFEVLNLGSDRPVKLREVIRHLEGLLGKQAKRRYKPADPSDVPATWADIAKARDLLDWSPRTRVEDGLAKTVAWFQENRSWASEVRTGEE